MVNVKNTQFLDENGNVCESVVAFNGTHQLYFIFLFFILIYYNLMVASYQVHFFFTYHFGHFQIF